MIALTQERINTKNEDFTRGLERKKVLKYVVSPFKQMGRAIIDDNTGLQQNPK